jgi:hypothetical protein
MARIAVQSAFVTAWLVSLTSVSFAFKSSQTEARTTGTELEALSRLEQFLRKEPSYRLLSRQDVRNTDFGPNFAFHAFSVSDTNGDGKPDAAAVLVKGSPAISFSLIVLHGGSADALWLKRDLTEPIVSVVANPKEIWPIVCIECDANRPVRWTGTEYDSGVYFPGEMACLPKGALLRERPQDGSLALVVLPTALETEVIEIGNRDTGKYRWFHVRVPNGRLPSDGWIRTEKTWEPGDCD